MPGNPKKTNRIPSLPKEVQFAPAAIGKNNSPAISIPGWAPFAVIAFTGLIYIRALFGELTIVDDDFYIPKNPYLKDFSLHGIREIFTSFYATNYHPLTTLTYFFEYHWFGLRPLPYHLLNVVLHLINTLLVFKFTERLSGKRVTAFVVCLLFAIHPMHVESVAWVAERKDVLYACFYLLALCNYLRYIDSSFTAKYYIATLLLFVAALFSKSAAVTLPVLMIVLDIYKGRKITSRSLLEKVSFLLLSILFGILAMLSQRAGGAINGYVTSYSVVNKLFIFTSALSFYIIKLFVPFGFSILHYSPYILGGALRWQYYASVPFLLLITWFVIRRSVFRKEMIFGVCFFLVTISVMLQIIPVGSAYVAERYTYISYIGLFYIIGQWIADVAIIKWQTAVLVLFSVTVIVFSYETWDRIGVWKNNVSLFNDLVDTNPEIYSTYAQRGDFRKNSGDIQGALEDYTKAIALNPGFSENYYKRSQLYEMTNNSKAAMDDLNTAIRLRPDVAVAYNDRGWGYFRLGNSAAAISDFDKAVSLDTNYAGAYNNRGWVYYQSGNIQAGILDFTKAIALDPKFDKPYYNRSEIESRTGNYSNALQDYNAILALHPDDHESYFRRGMTYFDLKDTVRACADWKKAIELGNKYAVPMAKQYCR